MKKIALLLALMLALSGLSALAEAVRAAGPVDDTPQAELAGYVVILHTGDTWAAGEGSMSFERVAEAKRRFEAEGASVLLLDAGNAFAMPPAADAPDATDAPDAPDAAQADDTAEPQETAQPDETAQADGTARPDDTAQPDEAGLAIARAMTEAGYDAMTPGEGDFALGLDALQALRSAAGFPLLSVNVQDAAGARLLTGSIIVEKDGLRIGVFGLTGAVEAEGVTVADAAQAAQASVSTLRGEGCDLVIALARLGLDDEGHPAAQAVAGVVEGLDAVIDITAAAPEGGLWLEGGALIASAPAGLKGIGVVAIDPAGNCAALTMDESWFG